MGVSKEQVQRVRVVCKCGCNQEFMAFPLYDAGKGAGLRTPEYKRGHHPNCRKTQTKGESWNKGLRKTKNPAVARQGKSGPDHWNYDPDQNPDWFSPDFDFRAFAERYGQKLRSKGSNKAYAKFRAAIMERDGYTCQDCGFEADEIEESDLLQVHHIVFVKHDKTRIFDPSNVTTLCYPCHRNKHRNKQVAAP